MEAAAARAGVVVAVGRFHADVGDEAGEQSAVDLFVAGFFGGADLGAVLFSCPVVFCLSCANILVALTFRSASSCSLGRMVW